MRSGATGRMVRRAQARVAATGRRPASVLTAMVRLLSRRHHHHRRRGRPPRSSSARALDVPDGDERRAGRLVADDLGPHLAPDLLEPGDLLLERQRAALERVDLALQAAQLVLELEDPLDA